MDGHGHTDGFFKQTETIWRGGNSEFFVYGFFHVKKAVERFLVGSFVWLNIIFLIMMVGLVETAQFDDF